MDSRTGTYRIFFLLAGIALACNLTLRTGPAVPVSTASQRDATARPSAEAPPAGADAKTGTPQPEANWPPTVDELLADCPTAAEVAEVDSKIHMRFTSDPTAGALACTAAAGSADLTREQKNAYNAVLIMKELKFDAPLPWTGQPLYDWFTDAIDTIDYRNDIELPCFRRNPPTIWMKSDIQALHSDRWTAVGYLVRTYVHEARHTYISHTCGRYQDNSIEELGAYGVEARFFEWLAYHSDAAFLTELAPGPTADYRDAWRYELYLKQKFFFCQDPTPSAAPPAVTPPAPSDVPVWTERMILAARSGVPVPLPVSPAADAGVPVEGAVFAWQAVEFPGGVTYGIEIDALFRSGTVFPFAFWQAFVDAAGIGSTSFTMPIPFDGIHHADGRWRVWAISPTAGAGPKSEWVYFRID